VLDLLSLSSPQTEYTDQIFKALTLPQEEIEAKEFYNCTFIACSWPKTTFRRCRFVECTFKKCDLSLIREPDCSFTNARFEDSKVVGVNWTEAAWPKGRFLNPIGFFRCVINHSTFLGLNLPEISIQECVARDVDFREADFSRADFTDTDFSESLFVNSNLTEADFTNAKNYNINASLNVLKKTKFSLPEAMSLLHSLDIVLIGS
jgi:fluoroquinolone resistance protein